MKDIPIIFSAPMVQALLAGRKTMTRRLAHSIRKTRNPAIGESATYSTHSPWLLVKAGDRLWVRESVAFVNNSEFGQSSYWEYRADTNGRCLAGDWPDDERDNPERPRWKPSIHMPRPASRLTLVVTETKVEPLQNISHVDAMAEGVEETMTNHFGVIGPNGGWLGSTFDTAPAAFSYLWMSLHGAESWNANPDVAAISFRVEKINIDAIKAEAAE